MSFGFTSLKGNIVEKKTWQRLVVVVLLPGLIIAYLWQSHVPSEIHLSIHSRNSGAGTDRKKTTQKLNLWNGSIINPSPSFDHLIPYRNATLKSIAFQKFLNGTGTVVVIHCRKAGGSSITKWFGQITRHLTALYKTHNPTWNSTKIRIEMWTYIHKTYVDGVQMNVNIIEKIFREHPFALYVIGMRHPIERILSQYAFEWRWGCQMCTVDSEMESDRRPESKWNARIFARWIKSPKYETESRKGLKSRYHRYKVSNIELDELLNRSERFQKNQTVPFKINYLAYLNNYYLWIFCCDSKQCTIDTHFVATGKIKQCIDHALRWLLSMDVLIIEEWMDDARMAAYVNHLFLGNDTANYILMKDVYTMPGNEGRTGKHTRGRHLMINKELLDRLAVMNEWDLKLYQHAKQLSWTNMRNALVQL